MATAPPGFFDPSQIHLNMPMPIPPPPPSVAVPSKSHVVDVLKILVGLLIVLILSVILAVLLFVPRGSNGTDLRESNEKIARLQRESNENIARLQREQQLYIENLRLQREEDLIKSHRLEDRLLEQQHREQQLHIENQRIERQENLTEMHRLEDRSIERYRREQELFLAQEQSKQQLEIEGKRLQILLEERQLAEQHRKEDLSRENADLLSDFMQEVISAKQPLDTTSLETKVHSLIRRFDSLHKSLLISFLYKIKLLTIENSNSIPLDLQGANLTYLDLDDMNVDSTQNGLWLNYTRLSLPSTNLINASFEQIYLNEANFSSCNMMNASFRWSKVLQTDFRRAKLSFADFHYANVSQSNFTYAKVQHASFQNANLSQARMDDADFESTNFQRSIAVKTNFSQSQISSANFQDADLFQARMDGTAAKVTNFYNAKAIEAKFSYAYMPGCIFQGADLRNASFRGTFSTGSNFDNANVQDVDFTGAHLAGASITPGQLAVALSIAQAILPDGSSGKNKNLVNNGNAECMGINGTTVNWTNSGNVFTIADESSTECAFQGKAINATLQQTIDIRRYERLIQNGRGKVYIEMREKTTEILNPLIPSISTNVRFFDSQNNEIGLEESSWNANSFTSQSKLNATLPCPSLTVKLQFTIVFRQVNATVDDIYVTIY